MKNYIQTIYLYPHNYHFMLFLFFTQLFFIVSLRKAFLLTRLLKLFNKNLHILINTLVFHV